MSRETAVELIEELITAAMAKADARVCVGSDRCHAFPHRPPAPRSSKLCSTVKPTVPRQNGTRSVRTSAVRWRCCT